MATKPKESASDRANMKALMDLDPDDPRAQELMKRICIPHATSASGAQDGVMPPWAVKYPKSQKGSKQLSGDEAIRKYIEKRSLGEVPYPVDAKDVQIGENRPGDLDPFTTEDPAPVVKKEAAEKPKRRKKAPGILEEDALRNIVETLVGKLDKLDQPKQREEVVFMENPYKGKEPDVLSAYVSRRKRVRMKLENGSVNMSVIAVIPDTYSITLILPISDDGFMFTPDPGSDVLLSWDGCIPKKCYFPGSQFEIPELKIMGMVFMCDLSEREEAKPETHREEKPEVRERTTPVKQAEYKYNPESGFMEDEFGLVKV